MLESVGSRSKLSVKGGCRIASGGLGAGAFIAVDDVSKTRYSVNENGVFRKM